MSLSVSLGYLLIYFPPCRQSVEMYLEMGKFGVPAKHHEAIALIYSKVRHSCASTIDKMNM